MFPTQQNRHSERQVNASQPRQSARTIHVIPARAFVGRDGQAPGEQSRGHISAQVDGLAIDLRVDWNGSAGSSGEFEVRVGASTWEACKLIDPGDLNDLVSPSTTVSGELFLARFVRGPVHGSVPFGVRAIPITWIHAPSTNIASDYTAERGQDYTYKDGIDPEVLPWAYSVLADGAQRLTLELSTSQDYEVWVRLQDPNDPNNWQIQDPLVRTGGDGGNPGQD